MGDVIVVPGGDDESSTNADDVAPQIDAETQGAIADSVVTELTSELHDHADTIVAGHVEAAVSDQVGDIVAEATAVTTDAQFASLHQRLDAIESQLAEPPSAALDAPMEAVVVVDDDSAMELNDEGITDGVVSDVEEGVTGTDTGEDEAPGKYRDEPDKRPNRKLGFRAFILGGSGGTSGRSRR